MQLGAGVRRQQQQQPGGNATAPRVPPPPPRPPGDASDHWQSTLRRTELVGCLLSVLFQMLVWRRTFAELTPQQHAHQGTLVLFGLAVTAVLCQLPPRVWQAYRVPAAFVLRAMAASVPSYRSMQVHERRW